MVNGLLIVCQSSFGHKHSDGTKNEISHRNSLKNYLRTSQSRQILLQVVKVVQCKFVGIWSKILTNQLIVNQSLCAAV